MFLNFISKGSSFFLNNKLPCSASSACFYINLNLTAFLYIKEKHINGFCLPLPLIPVGAPFSAGTYQPSPTGLRTLPLGLAPGWEPTKGAVNWGVGGGSAYEHRENHTGPEQPGPSLPPHRGQPEKKKASRVLMTL